MARSAVAERLEPSGALLPPRRPKKPSAPLWAKAFVGVGALLLVVSTGTYGATAYVSNTIEGSVNRGNLLGDSVTTKAIEPGAKVEGPMTFLIIGSDSRGGANLQAINNKGHAPEGERSDTIIAGYIPKSMDRAYLISFARDAYVPIANRNGDGFGHKNKINSAFADGGGAPRLVKTVNNMTGGKIDYPVIVDFNAVRKITDLVGGVDVVVDKTSYDEYRFMQHKKYPTTPCRDERGKRHNCLTFKKGPLHLDGELAEYYVRQRTGLANGDLDRGKRQQQYIRALLTKVAKGDTLSNPAKFTGLVKAVAESMTVDNSMNVMNLAFALKGIRSSDITFLSMPTMPKKYGQEPGVGSVVYPDIEKTREMFAAMQDGTLDAWIVRNGANDVSHGI